MASAYSKSEDSDFEPDNNFFDSFFDGMDILMDNPENSEKGYDSNVNSRAILCSQTEREKPLVGQPDSLKEQGSANVTYLNRHDEITALLTNNVLAHLEKTLRHNRIPKYTSYSTSQIVVDILDRLKKSVQQKEGVASTSSSTIPEALPKCSDVIPTPSKCSNLMTKAEEKTVSSHDSDNSETNPANNSKTVTKLMKWICNEEGKPHFTYSKTRSSPSCTMVDDDETLQCVKERRKHDKHRKHKVSRKTAKRATSSSRKRHTSRHRHEKKLKSRTILIDIASDKEDKDVNSEASLESVSSADDDILNRVSEEENSKSGAGKGFRVDREEGEVLSSSSSDCGRSSVRGSHRANFEPALHSRFIRTELCSPRRSRSRSRSRSPEILWPRTSERRRSPSPSWAPVYPKRVRTEDSEGLRYRSRSPVNYSRLSPSRRSPSDVRVHKPSYERRIPPLRRPASPPLAYRHRSRSRSPEMDRLTPPLVDRPDHLTTVYLHRSKDYHVPVYRHSSRRYSSPESIRETRHSLKPYRHLEAPPVKEIFMNPAHKERTHPLDADNGKRTKSPILRRCLKEVRRLSRKPGRFVYIPDSSEEALEAQRKTGPYSFPLKSSKLLSSPPLKFTTPKSRTVGTNTYTGTMSVGCQADDDVSSPDRINAEEDQQSGTLPLKTFLDIGKTVSFEYCRASSTSLKTETSENKGNSSLSRCETTRSCKEPAPSGERSVSSKCRPDSPNEDPSLSHTTVEMWKSIVSYRYPDLSEKEKDQIVLIKSMKANQHYDPFEQ